MQASPTCEGLDVDYNPLINTTPPLVNKQKPLYATRCASRKPEVKYQTAGHAKLALHQRISETSSPRYNNAIGSIIIYKLVDDDYIPIFDARSDLAQAFIHKTITKQELINRIDW